ncbi:MAG TPA: signal peptide peptidase SppA [Solimonas sp.]|nr:signal peptide peptidase SppA [Solimonas sp.]
MSQEKSSLLSRFFAFIWKAFVFLFRAAVVLSFVVSLTLLWFTFRGGKPVTVEDNVALVLAPTGVLMEQIDEDPGERLLQNISGEEPAQSRLRDLIDALEAAKDDPRISFAVLKLDSLWDAGLPQMEELVAAMQEFRASGKKIVAYGPWYEQTQYYAAAQADEIVVDPMGMVVVEGFSLYQNYFKEALDKLGVDVHVFRVGEYKSAVEPFTRNDMSAEARQAGQQWLGDLWSQYGKAVAAGRQLPEDAVDNYVSTLSAGLAQAKGDTAGYAKAKGLVTHVETLAEFRKRMGAIVGFDDDHGSFRQIHYLQYLSAVDHARRQAQAPSKPGRIALVVVQGEIVDGAGDVGQAGGDTITDLLDEARRDPDVAGVLLRVDSPGGSVWASEQIRRAVQQLKADGKPVVASMSTVAASGGYWVSMDANEIWAHESTITGSIGIFGLIPTLDRSLAKIGIHTDGVGTTSLAGAFRLDRPMSPEMGAIIQSQIDKGYRDFIEGVSKARKLPIEKVDNLARGRVWSGQDAKDLGLVDHFGGLDQAADAAARLAGFEPDAYELDERLPERDFASRLLAHFSGSIRVDLIPGVSARLREWSARSDLQRVLTSFNDPRGMYANCYCRPTQGGSQAR